MTGRDAAALPMGAPVQRHARPRDARAQALPAAWQLIIWSDSRTALAGNAAMMNP